MTNSEISALRKIAADSRVTAQSRLHAIDRLAGIANVYLVEEMMHDAQTRWQTVGLLKEYQPPGVRARRVVASLLRKLPPSSRRDDRLLFVKSEKFYASGRTNRRERLFRLKSPEEMSKERMTLEQTKPEQPRSAVVLEIETALAQYEEKLNAS